jgi:hypothetical protein
MLALGEVEKLPAKRTPAGGHLKGKKGRKNGGIFRPRCGPSSQQAARIDWRPVPQLVFSEPEVLRNNFGSHHVRLALSFSFFFTNKLRHRRDNMVSPKKSPKKENKEEQRKY